MGTVYLPDDLFYDYYTHQPVHGAGEWLTLPDVPYTTIPLYIRGGSIVPLRAESANTTTQLRTKDFTIVVAPGLDGSASGSLYLDDGDSLVPSSTSEIEFSYRDGVFEMSGTFGYDTNGVGISGIALLGGEAGGGNTTTTAVKMRSVEMLDEKIPLTGGCRVTLA